MGRVRKHPHSRHATEDRGRKTGLLKKPLSGGRKYVRTVQENKLEDLINQSPNDQERKGEDTFPKGKRVVLGEKRIWAEVDNLMNGNPSHWARGCTVGGG